MYIEDIKKRGLSMKIINEDDITKFLKYGITFSNFDNGITTDAKTMKRDDFIAKHGKQFSDYFDNCSPEDDEV